MEDGANIGKVRTAPKILGRHTLLRDDKKTIGNWIINKYHLKA
jgi:hypothetical protein